jgi:uncharacterized iron-regulated protein
MHPSLRFATRLLCAALALPLAGAQAHPGHAQSQTPPNTCLKPAAWSSLEGGAPRPASATEVLSAAARRDVVLLGEHHDDADHHRWQLQTLAALHAQRPNMVIGFEMFPRRVQPALDAWIAGELTAKQFLERSEWDKVWKMPAELYLPLFEFARLNRIRMLALNIDAKLTEAIADRGWEAVPPAEREGVGKPAPAPDAYHDFLLEVFRQHESMRGREGEKAGKGDPRFRNFVDSQTTWDRAMAEALARLAKGSAAERPLAVGIMGSGHIKNGWGVPHQLRDLGVTSIATLVPLGAKANCADLGRGYADAVFAVPEAAPAKPEPPRLGVRLEQNKELVRIDEVTAGSLAEQTGLRKGDQILAVAGSPVVRLSALIDAIRRQPEGTWLPVQVRRGDQTLDLVVKFPPRK